MPEWSTRHAATVDTVFRNGGHGVPQRWTRCAGKVDTVFWNVRHGVLERWTRRLGFASWAEVRFDAYVQLSPARDREPASAARREQRRLLQSGPAEHAVIERLESIFTPCRTRHLDMVNHVSPPRLAVEYRTSVLLSARMGPGSASPAGMRETRPNPN
ncbi:hypothetical protein [Kibdelosporangium philippinense]|uniref:hypothetical protein n=1 Tax=Kibdelosporangium philippinense TaxID=211113 RepID=UPI0036157D45